ncbi:MAG: MFS transporter [Rhodoglobus sp.]
MTDPSESPATGTPVLPNEARRSHFVDLSPLRESPPFARLWVGTAVSNIGAQFTLVAISLQVYDITHSTFAVALVSGFALLPMIVFGLYAGLLNDYFNRRIVLIVSSTISWASSVALAILAWLHIDIVWPLYVLGVIGAVTASASSTTRFSIVPRLVPDRLLPAASALNGISFGLALTVGPALAGVIIAATGFGWAYTVDVVLFLFGFLGIVSLPALRPTGETTKPGWASLKGGIEFLRTAPNIRMSFVVDIVAMTFGRPQVLFPAVGALVIGGGAVTVGVLVASGAVGVLLSSVFSGRLGGIRRHGVAIGWSIAIYGAFVAGLGVLFGVLATGLFGTVGTSFADANLPALAIGAVLCAGMGASDNVSSIFRMTMLQAAAPDEMRGRIQGVFTVVVTGGPRLGELFMGGLAGLTSLWLPPLFGGVAIIVIIALLLRAQRSFRNYDARNPSL